MLRNGEDDEFAASLRVGGKILRRAYKSERGVADARIDLGVGDSAGPPAYAGQDCDILLAVRPLIGDRLSDRSRAQMELPKDVAFLRVDGS